MGLTSPAMTARWRERLYINVEIKTLGELEAEQQETTRKEWSTGGSGGQGTSNKWTVIHPRTHSGFIQKATGDPEGQDHGEELAADTGMKRKGRRENF